MRVYMFAAALFCEGCGLAICEDLKGEGLAPANPEDESSFDSDHFPKGPYPDGGGESDSPQHCDSCGIFLENPLTPDGDAYVRERAEPYTYPDDDGDVATWPEVADRADDDGKPVLAEWIRYYYAAGM